MNAISLKRAQQTTCTSTSPNNPKIIRTDGDASRIISQSLTAEHPYAFQRLDRLAVYLSVVVFNRESKNCGGPI